MSNSYDIADLARVALKGKTVMIVSVYQPNFFAKAIRDRLALTYLSALRREPQGESDFLPLA
jgi:hypothetical protein